MYGLLWRALPGPWWVRTVTLVVLAVLLVGVCFQWVFPAVAPYVPFNDTTVGEQ
jgi:membrane protein implicated in regulation of membrane protease activity